MRPKSIILLLLALACGLVAAIGVTQVISKDKEPVAQQGDTQTIIVAAKDISPGELITPQMIRLEPWPKEKVPEDTLTQLEKVEGCRAQSDIYEGEPIRERKLLGKGGTRRTATDYIPKGYRVVAVKVDASSGGAGLIQPGDRVDVLTHFQRNPNKGIAESRTQTILQDIKVFAVDDTFKPDVGGEEEDSMPAKVIQLLVTPEQAETLVLAQQLGKVLLTMRPPGGEDTIVTPGKTPGEIMTSTSGGDRRSETTDLQAGGTGGPGSGVLDMLNKMRQGNQQQDTQSGPATEPRTARRPVSSGDTWTIRVIGGPEVSDYTMEESVSTSGEHIWRMGSGDVAPLEPTEPEDGQTAPAGDVESKPVSDSPSTDDSAPADQAPSDQARNNPVPAPPTD